MGLGNQKLIQGGGGLFGSTLTCVNAGTIWKNIIRIGAEIDNKGVDFSRSFRMVIGDGRETKLWVDRWMDSRTLKEEFGRLYNLETKKILK